MKVGKMKIHKNLPGGYTVSKIDKDQVKTLIQLFGKAYNEYLFVNFGTFPLIDMD